MAISRQKEARSRDYALLLFRMTSRVLYSAQYHKQHCPLDVFEQFGALYMHKPRWQISGPTGIRTWYLQVTSPTRYERAIGVDGLYNLVIMQEIISYHNVM